MVARIIKISGDVQGVNFRHWTKKMAEKLVLTGWTKNEHDGTVTIFVQGAEENVQELISWSHQGSPMATVTNVLVDEAAIDENLKGFSIK